ncbi:MAG: response regulator [Bacteroidetes bacterium]|nr:response regulator [Bacteroidota bacterium]
MSEPLSFFNWSLSKTLATEPDNFAKARIRIIYTILVFSVLKALIAIGFGAAAAQWLQMTRGIIALIIYLILAKVILYRPSRLMLLAHIMILTGLLVIWTNIYVYSHQINLVTLQFMFMIVLSGFYTLGSTFGIIYSLAAIVPVLLFSVLNNNPNIYITAMPQQLASPGFEIILTLNFVTIILAHYLFFKAFKSNIKEKEALNHQLQLAAEEANELAISKSNFLSTMSHELRTPLNSVIGITELLLEDKPEERQKENLEILQLSALDLLSLINNVLDFNKIDADKPKLEAIPFNLAEFIQNRCAVLKIKANDKQLDFNLSIDKRLENINIISDPTRLSQIIYNLISNAIKFTDKGSISLKLDCIEKKEQEVIVQFSVVDTGIGIHPERHEKIFELFTQAESHITRKYGGTGLGLAIVKQILSLFNSSIHLNSSPGSGSTFFFTINFATTPTMIETKPTVAETQTDFSKLKILVAEDNEVNRILVKKQMSRLNVEPVIVENGEQAYEACLSGYYDAVFMDLHMPILDGVEATKKIRALPDPVKAKTYILAFTASVTEQEKIKNCGFDDFLYKPINLNNLREKLENITANRSLAQ